MAKLWGGRFQKSTDKKVDDFNSSIRFYMAFVVCGKITASIG